MPISDNIKRIRTLKKVSVADLADEMGINVQSIYAWERGDYNPNEENLESMARIFKVPVKAFYDENLTDMDKTTDNKGKDIEPVLQELIERNEKYRLVPTIILDKYEILSNRELESRDKLLQKMLDQAEEISATKQFLLDEKDKLIDALEIEINELRAKLKHIPPAQNAQ